MTVVAIIQARMGSTRLPGKVLAEIGGRSMLGCVCDRVGRAALVDQVVVATTLERDDRQVVDECSRLGVACFRGSPQDVLDRYDRAARAFQADAVVRITADCPLIDPEVIDLVVSVFQEAGHAPPASTSAVQPSVFSTEHSAFSLQPSAFLLYASNTLRRTWPRGLDVEVMTSAALSRACREAREPHQRAHVTPYIYEHPEVFRLVSVSGTEDFAQWRWTVDVPEDLDLVRAVYARLGNGGTFSWRDVRGLFTREPALAELNRHVRQKQLVEG